MNDPNVNVVPLARHRKNQENHQSALIKHVYECGPSGVTWAELAQSLNLHHGQASGALSGLHRRGILARLSDKRGRSHIYVHPDWVGNRPTDPSRPVRLVDELYEFIRSMPDDVLAAGTVDWRESRRKLMDKYGDRRG